MGLRINQNVAAFNSYRSLQATDSMMSKSLERLSSGYRINRAADDAACLAISEGLRAELGGLRAAVRNAQDGISVLQTTEGALTEVHSILQRMRDLAVQAGNDSNSAQARAAITTEAGELQTELSRIATSTNFNGQALLDGVTASLSFQIGAGASATNDRISVTLTDASAVATAVTSGGGTDFAIVTPTTVAGPYDFTVGTTTSTVDLGTAGDHNTVADVATALNADAGFAQNFHATVSPTNELRVTSLTGGTVTAAAGTGGAGINVTGSAVSGGVQFDTATNAAAAITTIDTQITAVSTARASIGAYQNRFEHTINNLNVAVENLASSESRIRDTDMALEMVSFTRSQILSQAGTAMLAQANQAPQGVLQLLR